jgi:hypothetical protein
MEHRDCVNLFSATNSDKQRHLLQHETLTVRKFAVGTLVLEMFGAFAGKKKIYLRPSYYQRISITELSLIMSSRQYNAKKDFGLSAQ